MDDRLQNSQQIYKEKRDALVNGFQVKEQMMQRQIDDLNNTLSSKNDQNNEELNTNLQLEIKKNEMLVDQI